MGQGPIICCKKSYFASQNVFSYWAYGPITLLYYRVKSFGLAVIMGAAHYLVTLICLLRKQINALNKYFFAEIFVRNRRGYAPTP